jgi:hypothetical protein
MFVPQLIVQRTSDSDVKSSAKGQPMSTLKLIEQHLAAPTLKFVEHHPALYDMAILIVLPILVCMLMFFVLRNTFRFAFPVEKEKEKEKELKTSTTAKDIPNALPTVLQPTK